MAIDNFRRVDFTLDKANGYIPSDQFAKENDNNGRELTVQITDGGVIKDQSNLVLTLAWKHNTAGNEGQTLFTRLNGGQGIFTVAYDNAMMIPGTVTACIQIVDGERITNTRNFKLRIENNPLNVDKVVAEDSFKVFVDALAGLTKYDGRIAYVESEVATARGGYANLNAHEDAQDNAIDSKFGKTDGERYLNSITVVPETFANLLEIKAKYPNGSNGVMVAADNGRKYIWANNVWTDAGIYQSAGVADNSISQEKLSTNVYISDYLNLSNINLNGSNTIGVVATFQRSTALSGIHEINLRGTLKESCESNRLAQATFNIIGSEINNLTADDSDIISSKIISFDKTQKNIEKKLDLNFSVDLQQKPFLKLIITYAFDSNAGTSNDTVNLDPLELLVANENLSFQQKGIFIGNSGTGTISARITGKAGLVTTAQLEGLATTVQLEGLATTIQLEGLATAAQLEGFVTKNDIKKYYPVNETGQFINVTTAKEFVDAIEAAKNIATADHWVTINMAPGTYDLLPFVNLDIYEVHALEERGVEVPQYTKIVGDPAMGTLIVLRLPDTAKTEAKWTVSPINLKNDAWLENLKIISFNCRYTIHDDGGTVSYSRRIKNCILINEGHGNIEFVNETPYGCGIYKGCHAYYDNVTFQGTGMAAYVHDNPNYDIESSLIFNNCTFNGGNQHPDFAVRFHSLGAAADTNIKLINCRLNKPYQIYLENGAVRQSMVITGIGNSSFDDSVSLKLID